MTVHLLIKGKVQGVFFRAATKDVAEQLKVTGWVRNTDDGDVEAMATGEEDRIKEFILWCHKGPRRAAVSEVVVSEKESEYFEDFRIVK